MLPGIVRLHFPVGRRPRSRRAASRRPAGARASPHWTPHAQANAKSNPAQSSRLRAAHIAAFKEWERWRRHQDALDDQSSDSDDDADAFMDGEADLLSSFAERVEAEGGARRVLLESEASRAAAAAQEAQTKAGAVVTKALDLDGKAAKPSFPGGEGLLDTNSWRATVAFGSLTILLSLWAALTTDFGGVDASELDAQYERQFVRPVERDE